MQIIFSLLKRGCTLKGKNLLPRRKTPFQKGIGVWECKQDVTKAVSLVKHGRKCTKCIQSPNSGLINDSQSWKKVLMPCRTLKTQISLFIHGLICSFCVLMVSLDTVEYIHRQRRY